MLKETEKRLNSQLCPGCPLDSLEEVGERRISAKLKSIIDSTSHPLHEPEQLLQQETDLQVTLTICDHTRYGLDMHAAEPISLTDLHLGHRYIHACTLSTLCESVDTAYLQTPLRPFLHTSHIHLSCHVQQGLTLDRFLIVLYIDFLINNVVIGCSYLCTYSFFFPSSSSVLNFILSLGLLWHVNFPVAGSINCFLISSL